MPDLSPVMQETLERFKQELPALTRGGSKEAPRPHKLVMLLSVLDLADAGELSVNEIYYDDKLTSRFATNFKPFATQDDLCQPAPPFFHLRSSNFWFHKIKPGRERAYAELTTSGGGSKRILENIEYAYLRDDVFVLFNDDAAREEIRTYTYQLVKWPSMFRADATENLNPRDATGHSTT